MLCWSKRLLQFDGRIFVATQNTDLTWQVTMSPVIDSLVGGNFNCGDVDSLGVLYLLSGSTGTRKIFGIDVNPLSPTYLTIIFKKLIVIPSTDNFADWGFNPKDGKLYSVSNRKHIGSTLEQPQDQIMMKQKLHILLMDLPLVPMMVQDV